jgi:hypothetical protein
MVCQAGLPSHQNCDQPGVVEVNDPIEIQDDFGSWDMEALPQELNEEMQGEEMPCLWS